jgi:hypothetical protein
MTLSCAPAGTRKTSSAKVAKNVTSSVPELSSRNQSLLAVYSAEIENTADKIIRESRSAATRRIALEWKAEAIPVMQASLLKTDPVAAVLDTWVFLFQMSSFMERPSSKQMLGEFHPLVIHTIQNMEAEMEQVVRLGAPNADVAALRQKVSAWANVHPIGASLAGRDSVDPEVIKKVRESDLGTRASIQTLGESIGDLTARLDSYNTYAPKQARWQAELLLSDIGRDPRIRVAYSNLNALSNSAAMVTRNMDKLPEAVAHVHEALRMDVEGQRLSAQAFLREERLETLDALQQERIATLAAMHNERLAATADLRGEREVVLNTVHADQEEVMRGFQAISDKTVQNFEAKGRSLIDHFFVRALELMLVALFLCFLAVWVLVRWTSASIQHLGHR